MKYELKLTSAITEIHVPGTVPLLLTVTLAILRAPPPPCQPDWHSVMPKEGLSLLWKRE